MNPALAEESETKARRLAEAIREACIRAALEGYEQAGLSGMCEEGRLELAIDAIRSLNLEQILNEAAPVEARPNAQASN